MRSGIICRKLRIQASRTGQPNLALYLAHAEQRRQPLIKGLFIFPDRTTITVPDLHSIPVLYPYGTRIIWITQNGEITVLDRQAIAAELALGPPLVCHRRWSEARSGVEITNCLDLMELFAFARPARSVANASGACCPAVIATPAFC